MPQPIESTFANHPFREFSDLAIVLQIYAHTFVRLLDDLRTLESEVLREWTSEEAAKPLFPKIAMAVKDVLAGCHEFELPSAFKQAKRIVLRIMEPGGIPFADLGPMLAELRLRITEDLEDRVFFCVPSHKVHLFFEKAKTGEHKGDLFPKSAYLLFGEQVARQFPSALIDIEEASRCLFANRNTGAVFHLMRVMEIGLRAIAKSLADPALDPKRNPTWDAILQKCNAELEKPFTKRSDLWRNNDHFLSEATANLRSVKNAWRNPTMHVEISYDEEKAMDIWNSVRVFMSHLATKLSE